MENVASETGLKDTLHRLANPKKTFGYRVGGALVWVLLACAAASVILAPIALVKYLFH